ncbi:uncharacterized protein [Cherax quadricarinatus]|uniref:uncharacterized protein n=1 Tax=Cherax quadricarinatus TaxID=27406 RepID=UPI00387E896B
MTYKENVYMCDALGGFVPIPNNLSDVTAIVSGALESRPDCQQMWLNIEDVAQEGVWHYHDSGQVAMDIPWAIDEPNGLYYENCGGIEAEGVVDADCQTPRCLCCAVEHDVILTMRGSCETLAHDMNYMMSFENDHRVFVGYGDYKILHNGTHWIWLNHQLNQTVAYLLPSTSHYPMGRQMWQLQRPVCDQKSGDSRRLLLSVCDEGEYTCDDGTCIILDHRCDLKYDCRDKSDEADCLLVRLPQDYKVGPGKVYVENCIYLNVSLTSVAPRLLRERGSCEALEVRGMVTVGNLRVDTSEMILKVAFNLTLVWKEPRATYLNLKADSRLNPVEGSVREVWRPSVVLFNTVDAAPVTAPTLTYVLRQGSHTGTDNSVPEEDYNLKIRNVTVRVPLARRDGYAVISIYVPSLTMLVIGYLTLFFVRDNFEVRVMTSLTSLLVMATLFTQVAASLPKTSYFKLVDIWLLFCIFSTFFIIVFHIIIDLLLKEVKTQNYTPANRSSEKMLPLPEKIFLPRIGREQRSRQHQQEDHWQLQQPLSRNKPTLHKPTRSQIQEDVPEYTMLSRRSRNSLSYRKKALVLRRCKFGVSLKTAEMFAKVFMMVVFLIFNVVYWMIAYVA